MVFKIKDGIRIGTVDVVNNGGELLDPFVLGTLRVREAAVQDAIIIEGRAGGTNSYAATIRPPTLGSSITLTLPSSTGTVALVADIPAATRLRGTSGGSYTGGDLTLVNGTGVSISQTGADYTIINVGVTGLTGTANRVTVSGATGSVTISAPQDIHTGASPTFAGATFSGDVAMGNNQITGLGTPGADTDAATKGYVDSVAQGLNVLVPVVATTTDTLAVLSGDTVTYNNGTAGVGATLTLNTALANLDGFALTNGDRVLIKNQAAQEHNGIYIRTSSTVFTRATDQDTIAKVTDGDFVFVNNGTLYESSGWVQTEVIATMGTDDIIWNQFAGATSGTVTSIATNNGITGGTISSTGTIGLTSTALSLHQLATTGLVVRSAADTVITRTITAGANVSVTDGNGVSGNPTIACVFTDTLATVTGRGAVTDTTIAMQNNAMVSFSEDTAVDFAITAMRVAIATVSITTIDSWAVATYRSARYTIQITSGTDYQISEILVIHNGTTTNMTEYAVLETSTPICTFTTDVSGGNARLRATMSEATAATIKIVKTLLTI